jgi:hypothetical protein
MPRSAKATIGNIALATRRAISALSLSMAFFFF